MDYSVHRKVLDEAAMEELAVMSKPHMSPSEKVKRSLRCSGPGLKKGLLQRIPAIEWLRHYPVRENLLGDLVSGVNGGIMQLPIGIAYAMIANVPPVFGLYASFYPVLIYFIFGTSHHIAIGAYTVLGVMMRAIGDRFAPDSNFMIWDNVTNSSVVDSSFQDEEKVRVVIAVTILSGLFQILLGLVRFGVMVNYLSEPLVRGYTTGASMHILACQFGNILGVSYVRHSGILSLIYTVLEVCYVVPQTHFATLVVFVVAMVFLVLAKRLSEFLSNKLPIPLPVELFAVIISTVISSQVNLEETYGVKVVGEISSGLQAPSLPPVSLFGKVIGDAFAMAVVGYSMVISLGQMCAAKHGYKVDSNQELIALGLSNCIGGIFQCIAVSGSIPRTAVQESTGGKTQVAGAASAIVMLFVLLWIGSLLVDLPKAVLAAIIYINILGALKQFQDVPVLWRKNKVDMVIWIATFILTVLLNPDLGLAASIGFSLLTVIFRTQKPKYSLLGQVQATDIYRPEEDYIQVKQIPGILIFRSSAMLYFANAEMYQDALKEKSGIDVSKVLSTMKKLEAKRKKLQMENVKKAEHQEPKQDIAAIEMDQISPCFPRAIILDLSPVSFVDTMGIKALLSIHRDYGKIGVEVFLASCQTVVVDNLQKGGFFCDKVTKSCVFPTVHDAVLYCQSASGEDKETKVTHF